MTKTTRRRLAALMAGGLAFAAGAASAQQSATVRFEPGSDTATLSGAVKGNAYFDYVLGARAGQTMSVLLTIDGTNGHGSAYFNILPPGSDNVAIFNGSTAPDRFGEVVLSQSGDHTIRVYLMGNDKDAGKTVGYTLSVTIQ